MSNEYNNAFGDWGVPGSAGLRCCGPGNLGAAVPAPPPQTPAAGRFRGMDTNRDGVISRGEWRGSDRSFEVHDWNNDGVLSGNEVRSGAARRGRTLEDEDFDRDDRFEYLDTTNNGRIELREWHSTAAAFDRLDANNDNTLSRAEFARESRGFGVVPTSGELIVVDPTAPWTDTGLNVRAGGTIFFESEGTVRLSDDANDVATPDGARSRRRALDAPLSRAPAGGLIARIGTSSVTYVGDRRSFPAPASGRLYLGVNDDHLADNSGEFRVIVDIRSR